MATIDLSIHVSTSGRYFVDQTGEPFFWNGDTQWELFSKCAPSDARWILDNRAAKGINVIQVMLTGLAGPGAVNKAGDKAFLHIDAATGKPDLARPNDRYFANVDSVVEHGRRKGIVFVIGLAHGWIRAWENHKDTARAYANWVAARYRDISNIVWVPSYTATPDMMKALVSGILEGDGGKHLITVHPDPAVASSKEYHGESWLAFHSMQTWGSLADIYPMVTDLYRLTPPKPVVSAEGAYEAGTEYGFAVTPSIVRRQAYWACLAGGFQSYGHNDSWRMLPTWKSALDAPGASQVGVLRRFFASLDWWNLVPDQAVFEGGPPQGEALQRSVAARSSKGEWIVAYLADPTTVSLALNKLTASRTAVAAWVDPRAGARTRMGEFPTTGAHSFTTPAGWEDALLLLERNP